MATEEGLCQPCPAGHECSSKVAIACESGTYSKGGTVLECKVCDSYNEYCPEEANMPYKYPDMVFASCMSDFSEDNHEEFMTCQDKYCEDVLSN